MGVVYDAYDPELDRRVALKLLHPNVDTIAASKGHQRLSREAQAMARLAHPNVIPVHDIGTDGARVFFAMERVDGGTLRSWLEQPRPWREIVGVFVQAGRGLAAAHAAGIVHRDFKPDNVLVGRDGRVRVTDFGVARVVAETNASTHLLGRRDQVIGTPGFLAPEQLDGEATPKSDQFSFCVALFAALIKEPPFTMADFRSYSEELRSKAVGFPLTSAVPIFVQKIVLRGLHKDPDRRFPNMEALLEALGRNPRRRRLRSAVLAVTAIAVVVFGVRAAILRSHHLRACATAADKAHSIRKRLRPQIEKAFGAAEATTAAKAFGRVDVKILTYAKRWKQARASTCLASAPLAPALLEDADACLDHAAETLLSATRLLTRADERVVHYASQMIGSLPSPEECLDADLLANAHPSPPPTKRKAVAAAHARLAAARLRSIPWPEEAIREMKTLIGELKGLNYAPALASAYFELGEAQNRAALEEDAIKSLEQAAKLALGSRNDRLFIRAAGRLAGLVANAHEQERAADWIALAHQVFERAGRPAALAGWLDLLETRVSRAPDRWEACVDAADRILAEARRRGDEVDEVEALGHLVGCRAVMVGPEERLRGFEQVHQRFEQLLGPQHPLLAKFLLATASARVETGDIAGALSLHERALGLLRSSSVPPLQLAYTLEQSAAVLATLGRESEALARRREARAILHKASHSQVDVIAILSGLSDSERRMGNRRAALRYAAEASAACSPEVERRHRGLCGTVRFRYAKTLLENGRPLQAARQATKARNNFATNEHARSRREEVEEWARAVGLKMSPVAEEA